MNYKDEGITISSKITCGIKCRKADATSLYVSSTSIKLSYIVVCREISIGNSKKLIDSQKDKYKIDQSFMSISIAYKKIKALSILSTLKKTNYIHL